MRETLLGLVLEEAVLGSAAARRAPRALNVVDVVGERDEQVKEELGAAVEHFLLHGSAALESGAAANDEGEVVSPQLRVRVGRVGVGEAGRGQDDAAGDAGACWA